MNGLKIVSTLISISIYLYLILQLSRFKKEFKGSIHDDRTISKRFISKWEKNFAKGTILIIIATIFGIIATVLP